MGILTKKNYGNLKYISSYRSARGNSCKLTRKALTLHLQLIG